MPRPQLTLRRPSPQLPAFLERQPRARLIGGALALLLVLVAIVLVVSLSSGSSRSGRQLESIMQDDQFLLYEPAKTVDHTLQSLQAIGVDRVRITVLWSGVAPRPASRERPAHFNATDPADYPAAGWAPYDRVVRLAAAHKLAIDFTLTAPGPLWAMGRHAPTPKFATHWRPSAAAFGQFVQAVGQRYSGDFSIRSSGQAVTLPRVSFWTIWNEPNQPGWLAPQWRTVGKLHVQSAPRLYRGYVDSAWAGLQATGHTSSSDTILVGELAPEGTEATKSESPIPPMRFLRALYCVDAQNRPLRGARARRLSCPPDGNASQFVQAHPGLFGATGFAHHPYAFFLPPTTSMSDRNFVPLADISRLERALDQIFASYGVHRQLPIYITEYGYETNPPNPFRGVSLVKQAAYLDQAEYLAWRDPRIQTMAQFLLLDSAPNPRFPRGSIGYWSTFQTGLLFQNGVAKPSLAAYALPIVIPHRTFNAGGAVYVWAMLRAAPNGGDQHAELQWQPRHGAWRKVETLSTSNPDGFLTANVKLPGSGLVRLVWMSSSHQVVLSRSVAVRQR